MADEKIIVEVSAIVESMGGRVKHIFEFEIKAANWNVMAPWQRDLWARHKLWGRLGCEYKVVD